MFIAALACGSQRSRIQFIAAPCPHSQATLCHRRCSETIEVFWTLRLSGGGGLTGLSPGLHGSWVSASGSDQPEVPQFAWFFFWHAAGMSPCDCWFLAA